MIKINRKIIESIKRATDKTSRLPLLVPLCATLHLAIVLAAFGKDEKAFRLETTLQSSSSLHPLNDANRRADASLWLTPSTDLLGIGATSALAVITKDLRGEQKTTISNTSISVRQGEWVINPSLSTSLAETVVIPTSDTARSQESLLFGVRLSPRLTYKGRKDLRFLSASGEISFGRNFHQYSTSSLGRSNTQMLVTPRVKLSITPIKSIQLMMSFSRISAWSYSGRLTNSFEAIEEISGDVSDTVALSIGHSNSGNLLKDNGSDSNVSVFNEESSTIYGAVTVML